MSITDAVTVLNAIERHGEAGVGLVSLSAQTEIDASALRQFVVSHPGMIREVGNTQRYALNKDSKHHGDIVDMVRALEESTLRKSKLAHVAYLLLGVAIGVVVTYGLVFLKLGFQT